MREQKLSLEEHLDILEGWFDDSTRQCQTVQDGIQLIDRCRDMYGAALTSFAVSSMRAGATREQITEILERFNENLINDILTKTENAIGGENENVSRSN